LLLTVILAFTALPARTQEPVGIAFVQAPEQSAGTCVGGNMDKAFACAKEQCANQDGVSARDCLRVKWCYPAGWAADLFVQHKEGIHWHDYLCGWGSKEDLLAAVKVRCEGSSKEWLLECSVVKAWDNGKEEELVYSLPK
jgi:hypothetical protein